MDFDANTFDWNEVYTGTLADFAAADPTLLAALSGEPPGKVLDVGCGAGGLLVALSHAGWQASGIDLAHTAIAAAEKGFAENGVTGSLSVADATKWTPPGQYDAVTNAFALPVTVEERSAIFSMVKSATVPGGIFVLKEYDAGMRGTAMDCEGVEWVSLDELRRAFADWNIETLKSIATSPPGAGPDESAEFSAAFLVARRPPMTTQSH